MYGYLKFSPALVGKENYKLLKKYYCATCLALKRNYGTFAPLILSYDLVVVPVLLKVQDKSITQCDNKCFYRKRSKCCPPQDNIWKKIAAVNIAIAEQKINDSLHDEKRPSKARYKVVRNLLKKTFQKARLENPDIFACADDGMQKIIAAESTHAGIEEQGRLFSNMVVSMLNCITPLSAEQEDFIRGVSTWLCLIDAIDDYDEDLKQGKYNPLLVSTGSELPPRSIFLHNYTLILQVYGYTLKLAEKAPKDIVLKQYFNKIIPFKTQHVINKSNKTKGV